MSNYKAKCRMCDRVFDWDEGEGYAKMPDGTYLCSVGCHLGECRVENKALHRILDEIHMGIPDGMSLAEFIDTKRKEIGNG